MKSEGGPNRVLAPLFSGWENNENFFLRQWYGHDSERAEL